MIYIIDANNLAGKIGILKEKNFDQILIDNVCSYFLNKKNEIYLVFDSIDPFGDRYKKNNIIIVYAPKNELFNNADDKIIDLFYQKILNKKLKDEISLITDDREIIQKIKKISKNYNKKTNFISATNFAKIFINNDDNDFDNFDDRGISLKNQKNINQELLDIWKEK